MQNICNIGNNTRSTPKYSQEVVSYPYITLRGNKPIQIFDHCHFHNEIKCIFSFIPPKPVLDRLNPKK